MAPASGMGPWFIDADEGPRVWGRTGRALAEAREVRIVPRADRMIHDTASISLAGRMSANTLLDNQCCTLRVSAEGPMSVSRLFRMALR